MQKAKDWLGERADVRPSRELLDEGWFGPGTPHPSFAERIGDVALVMRGQLHGQGLDRRARRATCTSATTAAPARTR